VLVGDQQLRRNSKSSALVWMRANRYEWQQIGRRFACDRNTTSRRWHRLMELVAHQLNRVGTAS
jgi:hypothetical protein